MLQKRTQKTKYSEWQIYLGFAARSVILTFILEILNRGSIPAAFRFMAGRIVPFLCNALIIFTTLSISRLFGKRRKFFADLFTLVWLIFGVVNAIVLRYRMTPFSAEDFAMVPSLLRIAKNYLTPPLLAALAAGILLVVVLIVFMWLKVKKVGYEGRFLLVLIKTAVCFLAAAIVIRVSVNAGALSNEFENLADAYSRYGFSYCFLTSIVDVGIDRPQGYSEEMMLRIAETIRSYSDGQDGENAAPDGKNAAPDGTGTAPDGENAAQDGTNAAPDGENAAQDGTNAAPDGENGRPNIIMIQLESFFDPMYLRGFRFSEDPIPCFRRLREEYRSGFLTVPVVGAGTSNTEFEVLTGMSTSYFGAGEYPYNTILKEHTVEALPRILDGFGYHSSAVHNNTGTFYNRHIVFSQMGFDAFIPEEYMYDLEYTPNNWAKDAVLTDIMMDTLRESEERDFIYTITVQSHGRYPQERVLSDEERVIRVRSEGGSIPIEPLEYYVNEIHEVDQMTEELTRRLEELGEPTVLVLFGDHLPALGFGADDLKNRNLYHTEYVIWDNIGLEREEQNLQAEQLGSAVLELLGMTGGIIPRYHKAYDSEAFADTFAGRRSWRRRCREDLQAIEYDMLYGEGYIFKAFPELPLYLASNMKIRYRPITVTGTQTGAQYLEETKSEEAAVAEDALIVRGTNFNEFSRIMIDNRPKETLYLSSDALMLADAAPDRYDMISVGQFDENLKQLGKCANFIFRPQLGRPPR